MKELKNRKAYLLKDQSIRYLYQNRLNDMLGTIIKSEEMESEWINIKTAVKEATLEALGTKKKYCRGKA
jgi:hypothetical protein